MGVCSGRLRKPICRQETQRQVGQDASGVRACAVGELQPGKPGVKAALAPPARHACPARRSGPGRRPRCGRPASPWPGGARRPAWCAPATAVRPPPAPARSLSASSALVASSSSRIGASRRIARAMATRCFWPPDSITPAFAQVGVIALRQRGQEIMRRGRPGGGLDLGIGRLGAAKADVLARRGGEDHRVLRHQRDGAVGNRRAPCRDRSMPSSVIAPRLRVVEPHAEAAGSSSCPPPKARPAPPSRPAPRAASPRSAPRPRAAPDSGRSRPRNAISPRTGRGRATGPGRVLHADPRSPAAPPAARSRPRRAAIRPRSPTGRPTAPATITA